MGWDSEEIAEIGKAAGYKVTYSETLTITKPDLSKITDPELFAKGNCGLDEDTAFIKELIKISNKSEKTDNKEIIKKTERDLRNQEINRSEISEN